jgi:hypothetical protein
VESQRVNKVSSSPRQILKDTTTMIPSFIFVIISVYAKTCIRDGALKSQSINEASGHGRNYRAKTRQPFFQHYIMTTRVVTIPNKRKKFEVVTMTVVLTKKCTYCKLCQRGKDLLGFLACHCPSPSVPPRHQFLRGALPTRYHI